MAKKKRKNYYKKVKKTNMAEYIKPIILNEEDIILTYSHISNLKVPDGKRDWIENAMYELRQSANKYERECITILQDEKVKFIHQAPFVFDKKIYFADFYLPEYRTIIELDGTSHDRESQIKYDNIRNQCFESYKIKVIRIKNSMVNKKKIKETLSLIA